MRFTGQFTLSLDRAQRGTGYKYVVVKKGVVHYEYLPEFRPRYGGGIVNRFLHIPDKCLKPGGKLFLSTLFALHFQEINFHCRLKVIP